MSKIDLHIVAFNVPLPADYGGVIDVFYKLKALSSLGVKIALHCFDYGRGEQHELTKFAAEVHYYPREVSKVYALFSSPFTVKSRHGKELLTRLAADEAPILFESLQSCLYLDHESLAFKKKYVRAHNVEHHYYRSLANYESAGIRKAYYLKEAHALEKFESILSHAEAVFPISEKDAAYFENLKLKTHYLPAFYHDMRQVEKVDQEIKNVALYHGNLQVEENVEAVLFLLEVFKELPYQLVVAGAKPGMPVTRVSKHMKNVTLVESPSDEVMFELIQTSKLNCLPTFQSTGIKLKLLHALTSGNELLVNSAMVDGTGLVRYCQLAESQSEWRAKITEVMEQDLAQKQIEQRQNLVADLFDNHKNATRLVEWLGLAQ